LVLINREYSTLNDHYRPQLIQQSSRLKGVRYTALHVAAYKANASVCRLLINSNADVAAKDYKSLRAVVRLQKCQLTPRFAEDARRCTLQPSIADLIDLTATSLKTLRC
jgi:hypothetical protein